MEYIYRNGKRINGEPVNRLNLKEKINIHYSSITMEDKINIENQKIIEEVENHNKNREQEIQKEQQDRIQDLTTTYLKMNEMI